jgi:hypothetical protein
MITNLMLILILLLLLVVWRDVNIHIKGSTLLAQALGQVHQDLVERLERLESER